MAVPIALIMAALQQGQKSAGKAFTLGDEMASTLLENKALANPKLAKALSIISTTGNTLLGTNATGMSSLAARSQAVGNLSKVQQAYMFQKGITPLETKPFSTVPTVKVDSGFGTSLQTKTSMAPSFANQSVVSKLLASSGMDESGVDVAKIAAGAESDATYDPSNPDVPLKAAAAPTATGTETPTTPPDGQAGDMSKLETGMLIAQGAMGLGQAIGGAIMAANNKTPLNTATPFMQKLYSDAKARADVGLLQTEKNLMLNDLETNRRMTTESGYGSSMGSAGTSYNKAIEALNSTNRGRLEIGVTDEKIKLEKMREAESVGMKLADLLSSNDQRNYQDYLATDAAGGALAGAGIQNLFATAGTVQNGEMYKKLLKL